MKTKSRGPIASIQIFNILCVLSICACAPSKKHEELKAKRDLLHREFVTEKDQKKKEEALVELLNIEIMGLSAIDSALACYDEHKALLEESVTGRSLVAVAQAMKAGQVKEIRDKLKWLSASNRHFEELHEKWPNNAIVQIYHASTLAALPPEVGARDEAIVLVENLMKQGEEEGNLLFRDYGIQIGYIIKKLLDTPGSTEGDRRLKEAHEKYLLLFGDKNEQKAEKLHG